MAISRKFIISEYDKFEKVLRGLDEIQTELIPDSVFKAFVHILHIYGFRMIEIRNLKRKNGYYKKFVDRVSPTDEVISSYIDSELKLIRDTPDVEYELMNYFETSGIPTHHVTNIMNIIRGDQPSIIEDNNLDDDTSPTDSIETPRTNMVCISLQEMKEKYGLPARAHNALDRNCYNTYEDVFSMMFHPNVFLKIRNYGFSSWIDTLESIKLISEDDYRKIYDFYKKYAMVNNRGKIGVRKNEFMNDFGCYDGDYIGKIIYVLYKDENPCNLNLI